MSNLAPAASAGPDASVLSPPPAGSVQLQEVGAAIAAAHKSLKTRRRDKGLISPTPH